MWHENTELDTSVYGQAVGYLLDAAMERVVDRDAQQVSEADLLAVLLGFRPDDYVAAQLPKSEIDEITAAAALLVNRMAPGVRTADCLAGFDAVGHTGPEINPFVKESWPQPLAAAIEELPAQATTANLLTALFQNADALPDGDLLTGLFDAPGLLVALESAATVVELFTDGQLNTALLNSRALFALQSAVRQAGQDGAARCDSARLTLALIDAHDSYTRFILRRAGAATTTAKLSNWWSNRSTSTATTLGLDNDGLSEDLIALFESAIRSATAQGGNRIGERELLAGLLASDEPAVKQVWQLLDAPVALLEELVREEVEPEVLAARLPENIGEVRNASVEARPVVARDDLLRQLAVVFARRKQRAVLLHGESGTGKSALADVLAAGLREGRLAALGNAQVIAIDLSGLEGDDYTAAADRLMDYMAAEPSRIYVLDGFARYLKDHLGAVSRRFGDYAVAVIVDVPELTDLKTGSKPLNEFLELIEVTEPDKDTTAQILKLAATRLAAEYGVDFDDAAPAQAIRMTNDYLLSSRNPAKAVALLEQSATEVGAVAQLHAFDGKPVDVRVGRGELAGRLAKITGLPKETILGTGADKDYVDLLGANLVGQDIAVAKAAGRLDLIQKGMVDKTLPAAVFVFAGLSGTGKSELAKQIAKVYSATHSLISFAMESFTEAHSISQLIGSPPGYVGYEEGGALINALNRDPYAVVLLDEVEKAHPKIWDPFLNLFDEGTITDTRGVTASGTKAFFVLTSNIGQYEIAQMLAAGATPEEIEERVVELLPKAEHDTARMPCFRPEFIGRIMRSGGIVAFNALSFEALRGIAGHIVSKQAANYANTHNGKLVCDDEVLDWLARRVYQDNDKVIQTNKGGYLGARPLSSLVDRYVANKLAQKLRQVASAPLVRVVLNGEDTEVVPVFDDADAQTLLAQRRLTLLNRVERRFNEIVTVPDDALGRLDETQLARMDRLLSEVGAVL